MISGMRPAIHIDHAVNGLIFEQEGDHRWTLHDLERHRRRKGAGRSNRQAHAGWIILRIDVFPAIEPESCIRRLMPERGSEVWRVLIVPETTEVRGSLSEGQVWQEPERHGNAEPYCSVPPCLSGS